MTDNPADNLNPTADLCKQTEDSSSPLRGLYDELCQLDTLRLAYTQIKDDPQHYGIEITTLESVEEKDAENSLQQLSNDLQARTYQPARPAQQPPATSVTEHGGMVALRDLVVQAALKRLLEPVFPPAFPSDPEPEKTIKWLAGNIDRGFGRVYAVNVDEYLGVEQHKHLLARVRQHIDDPDLLRLLANILATQGKEQHGPLVTLLADIAFVSIDLILQQARAFSREGNFLHVHCTRVANQLVVLVDHDPRYDWLLPALQKRLREELSKLNCDLAAVESQSVDLTSGGQLCFLGFELRIVKGRRGEARTQYRLLKETNRSPVDSTSPRPRRRGRYHPLHFVQRGVNWVGRQWPCQVLGGACRKIQAVQVGWRHLPITLFPVLLFFFGWRSLIPWLCLTAFFVCNWRWSLAIVRSVGAWAGRHKADVAMGVCVLAGLVCLSPLIHVTYANLSREEAAPSLPPGFYLGQYNKGSPWDAEFVPYGLYVPPHFQGKKGPFPLIVFLHGYGERTKARLFKGGLPESIAKRFGPNSRNGPFEFVAFFPIDPSGKWQTGTAEVEDAMTALDYVIGQHRIDPTRVYLTGISNGGNGVWSLAETYPNKWAAVAPISSFISPDVQKVRHLPAWIFHGGKDNQAPVKRERILVQQLQEVKADVRYTEVPNKGHGIWGEAYNTKTFYDWLATKKKD